MKAREPKMIKLMNMTQKPQLHVGVTSIWLITLLSVRFVLVYK